MVTVSSSALAREGITAVLYPSSAWEAESGSVVRILVQGHVYRETCGRVRRLFMHRILERLGGVEVDSIDPRFRHQRMEPFLRDEARNLKLRLRVGEESIELEPTDGRGSVDQVVEIARDRAEKLFGSPGARRAASLALECPDSDEEFSSLSADSLWLGEEGVSVVSDIDDTIKHSEVHRRRELLRNTFTRPFAAVPGMPAIYRKWHEEGVAFHYVSKSPCQLYLGLREWFDREEFPPGSFHLRNITFEGQVARKLFLVPTRVKERHIERLLEWHTSRRFILVGDSGEMDAVLYARIFQRYPDRIVKILIRNVPGREMTESRSQEVFESIPEDRWAVFGQAEELLDLDVSSGNRDR